MVKTKKILISCLLTFSFVTSLSACSTKEKVETETSVLNMEVVTGGTSETEKGTSLSTETSLETVTMPSKPTETEKETSLSTETSIETVTMPSKPTETELSNTSIVELKDTTTQYSLIEPVATSITENVGTAMTTQSSQTSSSAKKGGITLKTAREILDTNTKAKAVYYTQLTDTEKDIYNRLIEGVLNYKATVTFSAPVDEKTFERVFSIAYFQNPELFWWSGKMIQSEDLKSCDLMYCLSIKDAKACQALLDKKVKDLVSQMTPDMPDLQKALICHNWLCMNITFDKSSLTSQTAYGAIVVGLAQCEGYAKGFNYLMNKLGIPCILITGYREDGGTHAWNQVYLSDGWYNVDLTWDDPLLAGAADPYNVSYRYMGVPTSAISEKTHFAINMAPTDRTLLLFKPAQCESYSQNADINYGSYASSYEEAYEKLKASCFSAVENNRRCAHVKIASDSVYAEVLQKLVTEGQVFNIKKEINAKYGKDTIVKLAASPKNSFNYFEITMTYGSSEK